MSRCCGAWLGYDRGVLQRIKLKKEQKRLYWINDWIRNNADFMYIYIYMEGSICLTIPVRLQLLSSLVTINSILVLCGTVLKFFHVGYIYCSLLTCFKI